MFKSINTFRNQSLDLKENSQPNLVKMFYKKLSSEDNRKKIWIISHILDMLI